MSRTRTTLIRSGVTALLAAGAVALSAGTALATPAGFYKTNDEAYYNNTAPVAVQIKIDGTNGRPNYPRYQCVGAHADVPLGPANEVANAYYTGHVC